MTAPLLPTLVDAPTGCDGAALRFDDGALTHAELAAAAGTLAARLAGATRVAVYATPTPAAAVGIVAGLLAGVAVVPVNPRIGARELEHVVTDAAPDLVLAAPGVELPAALAALPGLDVATGPDPTSADLRERYSGAADTHESAVRAGGAGALPPEPGPDIPALVVYTSGTTGAPKGVVLSRGAIASNLDALAAAWHWTAEDLLVHALPLFHVHGLVLGLLGPLRRGGALRHLGALDAAPLAATIDDADRPVVVFGVPTQYHRLVAALEADPVAAAALGRARLLVSGSAALTAADHTRIRRATGLTVRERYGLTETLILTAARAEEPPEPGAVGRPLPGTELRLTPLPDTQDLGSVEVRGPGLFSGYLNRPDQTAASHTVDGWFVTGDIGRWTPSGALALVGRSATDLISSGGYKIGAGEIENALLEHPAVAEAAVVGVADDDLGERVVAHVVAEPGVRAPTEQALAEHVATLLAPHKRPREVHFADALPRNDMGKIVKSRLPH